MTRSKQSKRIGRNERRAQHPPQMASAPHQPKTTVNPEEIRQYVLRQWSGEVDARHGRAFTRRNRKRAAELPSDLFPQPSGRGLSQVVGLFLIPIVIFTGIYFGARAGAAVVEKGWVAPNSAPHWILCTGLDMAISAGLGFQAQFALARC